MPEESQVQEIDESKIPSDLAGFTKWRQTGEFPSSATDTAQEVAPADAAKEPEVKADSESPTDSDKEAQETDTEHRVPKWRFDQELGKKKAAQDELKKAQARIAELELATKPKDVKPTAEASKAEPVSDLEPPKFPDEADFDTWENFAEYKKAYPKMMADFTRKLAQSEREKAVAEVQQRQQMEKAQKEFDDKVAEGRKRYEDFDKTIGTAADAIWPDEKIPMVVKQVLGQSPEVIDVLHVIGGDEETLTDFIETAHRDPVAAIRKASLIEALIKAELETEDGDNEQPAPETKEPKQPKPKPPEKVEARSSTAFDVNDDSMPPDEWARRRNEQLRAKGRR